MKEVSLDSVPNELLRRIRADAAIHFELETEPFATAAWQITNPYSRVLCIQLASRNWSRRVFAKLPLTPRDWTVPLTEKMERDSVVRKEFEVLGKLAGMSVSGATQGAAHTVTPLAFYTDLSALVTIEAVGLTLRGEYRRHARLVARLGAGADLRQRVVLCGRWLRQFHDVTAAGTDGFDLDELVAYTNIRLTRLVTRTPSFMNAREVTALQRAAVALASTIPANSLRVSGRHNDFASHNIIACPDGGVRVLDFTMFDKGENAFDVCNFWFELEMLKYDPSYSRTVINELQSEFLGAYGDMAPDAPDFVLARLRYSINRLLNALTIKSSARLISPHWHLSIRGIRSWLHLFSAQGR